MNVDTGEFRALTAEVAEHAAALEKLAEAAFCEQHAFAAGMEYGRKSAGYIIRTLEQARLERQAELAAVQSRRPRHLRAVDGGADPWPTA